MRKTLTRKYVFGLLLICAIAALLIQTSTKSVAESKTNVARISGQPANSTTQDEVMFASAPVSMSPEHLAKEPRSQTLQHGKRKNAILSDIEPAKLRELKNQNGASQFLGPKSIAPDVYDVQTDKSTSPVDKSLLQSLAPSSFASFEGPDNLSQSDGFLHGPPDGGMAAGPNHVVVAVNSLLATYSKTGTELFSSSLADWFTSVCQGCNPFDPRVIYDSVAGRWILIAVNGNKDTTNVSNYLLSVSQTSDPTGSWWLYSLNGVLNYAPTGENTWADFPHLGFDGIASASGGAIYITSNQFTFGGSASFRTSLLNILPKSSLYSGAPLSYWRASGRVNADGSQAFTLSPAATYGNPGGEFLVNTKNGGSFVSLWKVIPTYPPTAVNWTLQSTPNIGAYSLPPDASQPGSCALMATNDSRISSNSVWRSDKIYAALTEGHNWGGGNVAAVRFIQINTSTNAIDQNLTYGADGLHYFFPVVAVDGSENVVLTFARAGAGEFGGIRYTGRLPSEPANTLQGSAQLKAGAECVTSGRWGDYFAAALDPADTSKVWIFGEWAKDLPGVSPDWDWGTWIGQVGFGPAPRTLTVASSNPNSGVSISISPNDNNGAGSGMTQFTRTYNPNTTVNLTAPSTAGSNSFQKWQRDGSDWSTSLTTSLTMDATHTMTALYCAAPGAFSLSAPSNGQSLASTSSVNLTWGGSANANSYDVYFGTSPNPPFLANQTGTNRSVTVTPGQTYYWKVVAKVSCGSATSTAGVWSFSVQSTCNAPGAFSLSAPSNGQSLASTSSVNLTWGGSANANSYDVYFGTTSNPPFLANQTGTSRSVSVTPGQTYYWKVVAKVTCGSATSSTAIWSFSVQVACTRAQMTSPANGSNIQASTTFNWNTGTANTEYWLAVGTTPGGSNIYSASQLTGTSRTLNNLPVGTIYVRLSSRCPGNTWTFNDYSYTRQQVNYTITLSASPSGGGTVSGGGAFAAGSSRTVTATANSGYAFTNWTESGSVVSSSASYTFTLNSNRTLVANFIVICAKAQMTSPANGANIQATTTFTWNTGTANSEYWLAVGTAPGGSNIYSASQLTGTSRTLNNLPSGPIYVRLSSRCPGSTWTFNDYSYTGPQVNYTITLSASPSGGGTVSGNGAFAAGSSRTVTASANSGYTFANWTENGSVVSSSASYTFTLNSNRSLVANFFINCAAAQMTSPANGSTIQSSTTFTWNTGTGNSEFWLAAGTAPGGSNIYSGSQLTGTSQTLNNLPVGTIYIRLSSRCAGTNTWSFNDYSYTVPQVNYTIALSASPVGGGTVGGGGTFVAGSSRTVTATANSGYAFANWTENASVVSSSASYTFTLNGNRTLVANFTVICAKAEMTSPTNGSNIQASTTFIWNAGTANTEYWLAVGTTQGGSNIYSASQLSGTSRTLNNLPAGTIYVRLSSRCPSNTWTFNDYSYTVLAVNYTITLSSSPSGGGSVSGGGTFAAGSSRTVTATANSGYAFANWSESGSVVSSSASYTFTLNGNRSLVANFSFSCAAAQMTSPANGSNIQASTTFNWNTGTGNTEYWLAVGTAPGGSNVYSASQLTGTSRALNNLPTGFIYVRLSSRCAGSNTWTYNDYAYRVLVTCAKADMTSPANGASIQSSTTFTWNTGQGNTEYWLSVGTTPGGTQIYTTGQFTGTSRTLNNLPAGTIYVRLSSRCPGNIWNYNDYSYTVLPVNHTITLSASPSGGGTVSGGGTFAAGSSRTVTASANSGYTFANWTEGGSVVSSSPSYTFTLNNNRSLVANFFISCAAAQMTSPATNANIGPTATFTWNTGTGNAEYWLLVGTTPQGSNIYSGSQATGTSRTLNNLPAGTIYVRLSSRCAGNNVWSHVDYSYTVVICSAAQITAPANGATIGNTSTFTWNTGTGNAEYWLMVGTTQGTSNIYSASQSTGTSRTLNNLPDGTIHVRLSSRCATSNVWTHVDSSYTVENNCVTAQMTSPANNANVGPTATFKWNPGANNAEYWLAVGAAPGGSNIYSGSQGAGTSRTLNNLPSGTIYVRLSSRCAGNNTWTFNDYIYNVVICASAQITTPANGATLSNTATFTWNTGMGNAEYWLMVGTTAGGNQVYSATQGTGTSRTLNNLPDGIIYVRLSSRCATSNVWTHVDTSYTVQNNCIKGQMTSPANNANIGPTATFTWNTGANNSEYWLMVGTAPGGGNIYSGSQGTGTSRTLNNLPAGTIYVRLSSRCPGNTWTFNDYTYTVVICASAQMTSPANGSNLNAPSTTFTWNTGTGNTEYWLMVGTTPGGNEIYSASQLTATSRTLSNLPPGTIYVTLSSRCQITNSWSANQYSYTGPPDSLAQMTSQAHGATLGASSQTFNWSLGTGNSQYCLYVGNSLGSSEYFLNALSGSSTTADALPADGRDFYVRLYSSTGAGWSYIDYNFSSCACSDNQTPQISSPAIGSRFAATSVPFTWTPGSGGTPYFMTVGNAPGGSEYFSSYISGGSSAVAGLPNEGRTVYVRMWAPINSVWTPSDYHYKASE